MDFLEKLQKLTEQRNSLYEENNRILEAEEVPQEQRDQVKANQDQIVDLDDQIDMLERQNGFSLREAAQRMTETEVENKDLYASDEYKRALNEFIATGNDYAIRGVLDDTGSTYGRYLIPVSDKWLRKREATNPIRQFANVVTDIQPVDYTPLSAGTALNQGDSWSDTSTAAASTSVVPWLVTAPVIMHPRVYHAGMSGMDEEIIRAAETAFMTNELSLVINGTGSSQAYGIVARAGSGKVAAATDAITLAEFRALIAAMDDKFLQAPECKLLMTRATYATIIGLKRTAGEMSINPENEKKLYLDGFEVITNSNMDDLDSGVSSEVVAIADLAQYHMRETGLYVRKSNDATDPRKILFIVEKFFGANLLDTTAAKTLDLAAS